MENFLRMNDNFNFNVVPDVQQNIQTIGFGVPPIQQNVQYIYGPGYQVQNPIQGICVANQQQLVSASDQTFTCINQNGISYLAITPNLQQPPTSHCYQAVQTPQGLQLFQVINNPVNFGPVCIQNNPQQQSFFPQFPTFPQQNVNLLEPSGNLNVNSVPKLECYSQDNQQECEANSQDISANEADDEDGEVEGVVAEGSLEESLEENSEENTENNLEECSEENSEDGECMTEPSFEEQSGSYAVYQESDAEETVQTSQDPLSALTSLTSSLPTPLANNIQNSNLFHLYKNGQSQYTPSMSVPSFTPQLENQQILNLPDQQFPPNTRTFQVLVPTPQGMAVQTVVASYPDSYSPGLGESVKDSILNKEITLNPQLVSQSQELANATTPESQKECIDSDRVTDGETSDLVSPTIQKLDPISSPCHSTTSVKTVPLSFEAKPPCLPEPKVAPISNQIEAPLSSPHCLPDSTEDLCQPTIKQSTSNVVDGINLEEIREFARTFKMRRLVLGLTQTQVGQALCATEGPAYSQSAICRFEKLDITPRSALKIRPVLETWLREAEEKHQKGNLQQNPGMEFVNISAIGKIRKRRTFFSPEALVVLNNRFEESSHPSGREISNIAQQIGYERDVVRVWFCNKRQSLRHSQTFQRSRISLKSSAAGRANRRHSTPSPNPP